MANNSIRGITLEIGGDTTRLSKALSQVNKDLRSTQTDLNAINKALKLDPTNVNLLRDKHELLGKAIQETNSKLDVLKEAYRQGLSNPDIGEDEMRALQREIDLTESSLNSLTSEYENFGNAADGAIDGAIQDSKTLAENLEEAGNKIKGVGDKISGVGSTLTKTVTAPIVAAGTASVKTASDFETSMAKVQTIADESVDFNGLRDGILALSTETGIAATDVAENVYNAISAGQETADAVSFVGSAAKLSTAGFAESADALDLLTTTLNAYGMEADQVTRVSDVLIQTQNMGKTTVGDLAASMGKIIPTAKSANVEFEQIAAGMAKLTANGINTAEATTYFGSMLDELSKSGTGVDVALKELTGKSFAELMSEGMTIADVLNLVQEAADNAGVSFGDMWSSTTAKKAAGVLNDTTNKLGDFNAAVDAMKNSAGATEEAFATVSGTTAGVLNKSLNDLRNIGIDIGTTCLPAITEAATVLREVLEKLSGWWNSLNDDQQEMVVKAALAVAAIGPLVTVFGKLTSGIGGAISLAGKFSGWLGTLGGATSTLSTTATATGEVASTVSSVGTAASGASQGLNAAGGAMGVLSQNALGFVALGGGIALAAGGMWILAKAAVVIAEGGWGAAAALLELVAAIAALAAVFAALGAPLTAGAVGIGVFGAAVLAIGAAIGIASAGLALLLEQLPLVAEYGQPAADAFVSLGAGILSMSTECLTATPGLLAIDAALIGLAASTIAADVGWIGFAATMGIAAAAVGVLDLAMGAFALTMSSIQEDATKAGEAIGFIQENVDVIKSGVEGLKDIVENGLSGIVDFFKDTSTEPVDAWAKSFSALYDSTSGTLINVTNLVLKSLAYIKRAFANTQLSFNKNIVLPHFSLDGAFDLQAGTVPQVNVNWYKTGGIFDSPSVIGVGEAGTEAVTPIDKLQAMIDSSTAKANNAILNTMQEMLQVMQMYLPQNRQVVLDSGVLVGEIAPAMDNELGVRANRRSRQA